MEEDRTSNAKAKGLLGVREKAIQLICTTNQPKKEVSSVSAVYSCLPPSYQPVNSTNPNPNNNPTNLLFLFHPSTN